MRAVAGCLVPLWGGVPFVRIRAFGFRFHLHACCGRVALRALASGFRWGRYTRAGEAVFMGCSGQARLSWGGPEPEVEPFGLDLHAPPYFPMSAIKEVSNKKT